MASQELLTAAQVAGLKGVSRRMVLRWVEAGRIAPAMRLPGATGALLFDRAAIESFDPEQVPA